MTCIEEIRLAREPPRAVDIDTSHIKVVMRSARLSVEPTLRLDQPTVMACIRGMGV